MAVHADIRRITLRTLGHYEQRAEAYWEGTRDHDVSENRDALLRALEGPGPFSILDLGCGPGRDVRWFRSQGHEAVGLDGSARFVEMARRYCGCDVLHQDLVELDLESDRYHGIFANASLFHVPSSELPRVLRELFVALRARGVLFSSNPRGDDREGWSGDRYGCFWSLETWRAHLTAAGFEEVEHYYRPAGAPREQQPWLATTWRRP
jgi:SAM-dependent methyltransferase